jgi:nucleoid-associated protein YgaU
MMVLFVLAGMIVLLVSGCGDSKKVKALQQENQILNQRVAELEGQLQQATAAAYSAPSTYTSAPAAAVQPIGQQEYLVVKGDTLWSIAKRQLGNGARYKEILALNPQLSEGTPLKVGSRLILPGQ